MKWNSGENQYYMFADDVAMQFSQEPSLKSDTQYPVNLFDLLRII